MRSLEHARQQGRAVRQSLNLLPQTQAQDLLASLRSHFESAFQIELCPVPAAVIDEGRAEVSPAEHVINYDERLDNKPAELLWVLAHELGHLVLHKRLTTFSDQPDPLQGSAFLNYGAAGLARYSRRAREEAEANAFANEFVCPSQEIFAAWQNDVQATAQSLAAERALPERLVRVQLAEALYHTLLTPVEAAPLRARKPVQYNERQLAAATFLGAPALVTAGPGTGKTATLIRRIEFLLGEHGAQPQQLLVLTFSNDAAEELRARVAATFGDAVAAEIEISTFHGFGLSFLHTYGLELDPNAAILDEAGQEEILNTLIGTLEIPHLINVRDPAETVKRLARQINYLKDRVIGTPERPIDPEAFAAHLVDDDDAAARELLTVFRAYEAAKRARPAVDFADLIALPGKLLAANPTLRELIRAKYRWVLVDEYQDVSRTVALLLRQLCGPENPPWVVGDLRQAIYRFRGAAPENVSRFDEDFPGAQVFELDVNYRSCNEVINTANQLAALLAEDDHESKSNRWRAGSRITARGQAPIALARVNSDAAEYEGIAAQVKDWLRQGVPPSEIAVLARRNLDVRNIALALGARGIRAATSGLITPEGAAGDLAAVITLIDQPAASLPRVVFSLGRDRYDNDALNETIRQLAQALDEGRDLSVAQAGILCYEIQRLYRCLSAEYYASDAFALLGAFLFNGSDYLRRVLNDEDAARRALALSEIVTSLSRAASFRFTHPDLPPQEARLIFAEQFRNSLSASAPSLEAPPAADAVRVMTCHAAKGLEFPCVIVAGQTLSQAREEWWLPASLRPDHAEEQAQADALLFVGVTRAQSALVVSCADTRSGTARARQREATPLLERWQEQHSIALLDWSPLSAQTEKIATGAVWGGALRGTLAARALDDNHCAVRTYLEDFVGVRFPIATPAQYPAFYAALRRTLQQIVGRAQETGAPVAPEEAADFFTQAFPHSKFADHPHYPLYQRRGADYAKRFAQAYSPEPCAVEFLADSLEDARLLPLRFDLVACYRAADDTTQAITFRPESLATAAAKNQPGELLWSGLDPAQRSVFLLLRERYDNLIPWVFSAADGVLYRYLWNQRPANMAGEAERVKAAWRALSQRQFAARLNLRACDRCPARIACPHWLKAT